VILVVLVFLPIIIPEGSLRDKASLGSFMFMFLGNWKREGRGGEEGVAKGKGLEMGRNIPRYTTPLFTNVRKQQAWVVIVVLLSYGRSARRWGGLAFAVFEFDWRRPSNGFARLGSLSPDVSTGISSEQREWPGSSTWWRA
jgi:hypothetical protein